MAVIVIYAAIVLAFSVGVLRKPSIGPALVFCMFGFEQWAQSAHPLFTRYHAMTNYIIGAIVVLALAVSVLKGRHLFFAYPKTGWITIALFAYALTSVFWSPVPDLSMAQWSKHWPYIVTVIGLSPLLLTRPEDLRTSQMALLLLGTVLVVLLLFTTSWESRFIVLETDMGTEKGNPLAVAQMAGYVFLVATLWHFKGVWRSWGVLRWLIAAACIFVAVKSGSRGQFFSMLLVAVMFLPVSRRIANPRSLVAVAVGALMIVVIGEWAVSAMTGTATESRWTGENIAANLHGRIDTALHILAHWYSSPMTLLFGLGNSASFDPRIYGWYPHVVPLEVLAEEGIIGFSLFTVMCYLGLRSIMRIFRRVSADAQERGTIAVLGAMFVYELLLSFKQGSLIGSPYLFALAVMLGKYERYTRHSPVRSTRGNLDDHPDVVAPTSERAMRPGF